MLILTKKPSSLEEVISLIATGIASRLILRKKGEDMGKIERLLIVIVVASLGTFVYSGPLIASDQRDGNWWRQQQYETKLTYIVGFFDGMELGKNFSYWNFTNDADKKECHEAVSNSYKEYTRKYFQNVSNDQLVDGLNRFYEDFRNRRILLHNAVWLIVNEISGTPEIKMKHMIENWRKNAP